MTGVQTRVIDGREFTVTTLPPKLPKGRRNTAFPTRAGNRRRAIAKWQRARWEQREMSGELPRF